jgi:hypothetical protein
MELRSIYLIRAGRKFSTSNQTNNRLVLKKQNPCAIAVPKLATRSFLITLTIPWHNHSASARRRSRSKRSWLG